MAKQSVKHMQIDKANATMVAIIAAAAFITIFSLVASKALLSQRSYEAKVIGKKKAALAQLKANNQAAQQLVTSYQAFVSPSENIIGGNTTGSGDKDGDNAKIVLDALPSKYDFPAMVTSLEKILSGNNYKINSITGTDDSLNQTDKSQAAPQPVEMPFEINVTGTFDSIQSLADILQRSIRPIHVDSITLSGKDATLTADIAAKTYYQPEKAVSITKEVVK